MPTIESPANVHANIGPLKNAAPSTPAPPPVGTVIDDGTEAGALQLTSVLGYGGYGVVYRAVAHSGTLYAVKCLLRSSNPNNPKQAQRQRRLHMREIALHRLAGAGAHPGVVRLHRVIEPSVASADGSMSLPSPYTFLVMDFAPCGDLFTLILHRQVYLGQTALVARVFAQLADAVQHCHSLGIFHRDLKPENVLCWDGGSTVKLSDFGLATTERRSKEWRTGSVYHMSPECQNGTPSSLPYSPLANDIWSLAILLLNLLTARNPWARASPSDPTFSAYLQSPRNFLPQVLPISSGLNDILVRALDVQWERREMFGVEGLADGVARLCAGLEDGESRHMPMYARQKMGLYAPDVVFEGGMARCPWEVGMHIPSGSSGSDAASNQIRIPPELEPRKATPGPVTKRRSSSASFIASMPDSPSPSMIIESAPPRPPAKDPKVTVHVKPASKRSRSPSIQLRSRWSAGSSSEVAQNRGNVDSSISTSFEFVPNSDAFRQSIAASTSDGAAMSEIRFAAPSGQEISRSVHSSSSSCSSSEVSSMASVYSTTRQQADSTFGNSHVQEPRVSDSADAEEYVYAYAATPSPDEMKDVSKPIFTDVYTQPRPVPIPADYVPTSRRGRFRGRSRGRQPYPQLPSQRRESANKTRVRKAKPNLKLNLELPTFLHMRGSSELANGEATARTRTRSGSPTGSIIAVRKRARDRSVSSCPFAYNVSRSANPLPDPGMDVDRERAFARNADFDVHMRSPETALDREAENYRPYTIAPSPISLVSPAVATENAGEQPILLSDSGHSPSSEDSSSFRGSIDSNGREIVKIDRSTVDTLTVSPTEANLDLVRSQGSLASDVRSGVTSRNSGYSYGANYVRSTSPSASSSLYRANLGMVSGIHDVSGLADSMDTDALESYASFRSAQRNQSDGAAAWVSELRKAVEDARTAEHVEDAQTLMDTDEYDGVPSFPGSFPGSPAPSVKYSEELHEADKNAKEEQRDKDSYREARGLDLDLYSRPVSFPAIRPSLQNSELSEDGSVVVSSLDVPPPSIRTRSTSADAALRELHAIAVEAKAQTATSSWRQVSSNVSPATSRGSRTFLAMTSDVQPQYSGAHVGGSSPDLREFVPYLQYANSGSYVGPSKRATPLENSHRETSPPTPQHTTIGQQQPTTFEPTSNAIDPKTSSNARARSSSSSGRRRNSSSQTRPRSRSRTASLLKFVARRPFSTSGAGCVPFRSQSPPSAVDPQPGFNRFANASSPFRDTQMVKDEKRPRSRSDPHSPSVQPHQARGRSNRPSSSPPSTSPVKVYREEKPAPPLPSTAPKPVGSRSKARTWSFTHSTSNTHSRRRSRSLSPTPAHGSPRDVLFFLRHARNWFWFALSGMTSGSPGSGLRKGNSNKWTPAKTPLVSVTA